LEQKTSWATPGAFAVHGIRDEELEESPSLDVIKEDIIRAIKGKQLVTFTDFDQLMLPDDVRDQAGRWSDCRKSFLQASEPVGLPVALLRTDNGYELLK
jgi:hypothetical protein